jgi:hypothetical protein
MLKQIPDSVVGLMDFYRTEVKGLRKNKNQNLNEEDYMIDPDILKDWLDLPTTVPQQNFTHCYGIVKIKGKCHTVCDLVQDFHLLNF